MSFQIETVKAQVDKQAVGVTLSRADYDLLVTHATAGNVSVQDLIRQMVRHCLNELGTGDGGDATN